MADFVIEQAMYSGPGPGRYRLRARSPGFRDEWLREAERLCDGFGERPAGVTCPACVFVQPLGRRQVAVVQVADNEGGALGFRLLVISQSDYLALGGNPFFLADRFPARWQESDPLPALTLSGEAVPGRGLATVQCVLQREDSAVLLGGIQALLDGSRLVFERPAPDTALLRDLWALLPTSTRTELWPASFAFSNTLGFHALVVPHAMKLQVESYLNEEQAADYPEGRYEFALQFAAETGDQRELERLFARRSRAETFRLGVMILVASLIVVLVLAVIKPDAPKAKTTVKSGPQSTGPKKE